MTRKDARGKMVKKRGGEGQDASALNLRAMAAFIYGRKGSHPREKDCLRRTSEEKRAGGKKREHQYPPSAKAEGRISLLIVVA